MSEDPWKHRSESMKCSSCMWFVLKEVQQVFMANLSGQTPPQPVEAAQPTIGRCRKHAPTMGGYPVTYVTDWCGDHKLDENKIP